MDEIVKVNQHQIISTFDDAERAARAMAGSGFFQDAKQANQAIVKILAGQELGFGPFASMTGVAIIQGKPAVGANLQAAAVKRTGKYNYRVIEMSNEVCELEFYEGKQSVGKSRFTMQDAVAAGLATKDNWKKWPRNMLFARAISNGVKWYSPDIFNGATVYTPDELDAQVDEDGNAVITANVEPLIISDVSPDQSSTSLQGVKTAPKTEPSPTKLVQRPAGAPPTEMRLQQAQHAEKAQGAQDDEKLYRYNSSQITNAVAASWAENPGTVAQALHAMYNAGNLPETMTISEAALVKRPE